MSYVNPPAHTRADMLQFAVGGDVLMKLFGLVVFAAAVAAAVVCGPSVLGAFTLARGTAYGHYVILAVAIVLVVVFCALRGTCIAALGCDPCAFCCPLPCRARASEEGGGDDGGVDGADAEQDGEQDPGDPEEAGHEEAKGDKS